MKSQFPHPFKKAMQDFRKYQRRLPTVVSQKALLEMKYNFKIAGYRGDAGVVFWKERKGGKDKRRALLIKTGRLRRSLKAAPVNDTARVVTDVPYARALNEGFKGSVRVKSHGRNLSKKSREGSGVFSVKTRRERMKTVRKFKKRTLVRGHRRRMNLEARPFLTVGTPFMNVIEREVLRDIEKIFINA